MATSFRRWMHDGVWEQINQALNRQVRLNAGGEAQPSLGLIDSQSVKMAQKGGQNMASMVTRRSSVHRLLKAVPAMTAERGQRPQAPLERRCVGVGFVVHCQRCQYCRCQSCRKAILVPALENNARTFGKVLALPKLSRCNRARACSRHPTVSWNSPRNWDKALWLSLGDGWSSARSRGWNSYAGCAATMRSCQNITRASSTSR